MSHMPYIKHTISRNETYHYNTRFNDKFYRKTLKTDSPKLARLHVSLIQEFLKDAKALSKSSLDTFIDNLISEQVTHVKKVAKAIIEPTSNIGEQYHQDWYELVRSDLLYNYGVRPKMGFSLNKSKKPEVSQKKSTPTFDDHMVDKLEKLATSCSIRETIDYLEELNQVSKDPEDEEPKPIPPVGIDVNEVSCFIDEFSYPSLEATRYYNLKDKVEGHTKKMALAAKLKEYNQLKSELESIENAFPCTATPIIQQPQPKIEIPLKVEELPNPTFGELVVEYLEYYKPTVSSPSTYDTVKRGLTIFCIELGEVPIGDIKLQYLLTMWKTVLTLPLANKKKGITNPYIGMPVEDRWEAAKDVPEEMNEGYLIGRNTLTKYKGALTGFFAWAHSIKEVINKNPIPIEPSIRNKFDLPKNRVTKRVGFDNSQAKCIIDYCKKNIKSPYHWVILLMSKQGMRNSEVINLRKSDILTHEGTGIPYIFIRKGKTINAQRKVPIHKDLLDLDFLKFVEEASTERLFNYAPHKLSVYYFNVLRPKLDIPDITQDGSLLSLYSFRKATITKLGFKKVAPLVIKYLVGHDQDTTDGYFEPVNDDQYFQCRDAINEVAYE
jgi:integrase